METLFKFFIGIIITMITSISSLLFVEKYKKRFEFFNTLKNFNKEMLLTVNYTNYTVDDILKKYDKNFNEVIFNICNKIKINELQLTNDELNFVSDYLFLLGKSDRDFEIKNLTKFDCEIEKIYCDSKKEYNSKKQLYVKLGFFIGLVIMIVII